MNSVSIIIPCYNHADYLPEAIQSALRQTHTNREIIICDDASYDDTQKVISSFTSGSNGMVKAVKHIHNRGLSAARNSAIAHAKGDFILPLDADDKIEPTFIERALSAMVPLGPYGIVAAQCQEFGQSTRRWNPKPNPTHTDFLFSNQINHCALFTKEMWTILGGYDEQMRDGFEDWDLWTRATGMGYIVSVIPEPLFLYRKRGPSMVNHAILNKEKIVKYMRDKYNGLHRQL